MTTVAAPAMSLGDARNAALAARMRADEDVLLLGGIAGRPGMAITVPEDLASRTIDVSISELGAVGSAIGLAISGLRPVITVHFGAFMFQAWPQIIQEAANQRLASGGQVSVPMVVHMEAGVTGDAESREQARRNAASQHVFDTSWGSLGAQHALSPQALLWNVPHVEIACPATPADAAGLLNSAIDSDRPTFFVEHRDLLFDEGPVGDPLSRVPFGQAAVRRAGSDVTIVAHSIMVKRALAAAEVLESQHGVSADVLDLRTIAPLDHEAILASVERTGRLVVAEQGHRSSGVGAGIASIVVEHRHDVLQAPVSFVCLPDDPVPFAPSLLDLIAPSSDKVVSAALATLGER